MATKWYCDLRGNMVGPIGARELLEMVRAGDVTATTLVRKNDSRWFRADEVTGLFEAAFGDQTDFFGRLRGEQDELDY